MSLCLTLAGFLLLQALFLRPSLCLAAELSRQPKGLAGRLKSPGTTRGLIALLEAAQESWEEETEHGVQWKTYTGELKPCNVWTPKNQKSDFWRELWQSLTNKKRKK